MATKLVDVGEIHQYTSRVSRALDKIPDALLAVQRRITPVEVGQVSESAVEATKRAAESAEWVIKFLEDAKGDLPAPAH